MSEMEIRNQTPDDLKAKKFLDLVLKKGEAPSKAAQAINVSLKDIRTKDGMWAEVRSILERSEALMDPEIRKKVSKAKLLELAIQDEDLKVSLGAVKTLHEELGLIAKGGAQVQVQVNVLREEPTVKAALGALDAAGELIYDAETKTYRLAGRDDPAVPGESAGDSDAG